MVAGNLFSAIIPHVLALVLIADNILRMQASKGLYMLAYISCRKMFEPMLQLCYSNAIVWVLTVVTVCVGNHPQRKQLIAYLTS